MSFPRVQVHKPAAVARAQQAGAGDSEGSDSSMGDDELLSAIVAFQLAVGSYVTMARQLLAAYEGWVVVRLRRGSRPLLFGSEKLMNKIITGIRPGSG